MNDTAKEILKEKLGDLWNTEENRFRGDVTESEAMESVVNKVLMRSQELRTYLTRSETNIRQCLIICQQNQIYSTLQLIYEKENEDRTIEKLQKLGFSAVDSEKIYNNEGDKKMLQTLYVSVNGLQGDSENPRNVTQWLADNRMKHYVWRDGMMMGIFQAIQAVFNMTGCCMNNFTCCEEVCRFTYKTSGVIVQRGDIIIAIAIASVHLSGYLIQWWYGDITFKQLFKSIVVTMPSMAVGFVAAMIALAFGPVGIAGVLISSVTAAIVGGGSEVLIRMLVESLFPDGYIEEANAKRLLYHKALKALNCTEDSSCREVQTQYRQLAQLYYPKRHKNKSARDATDNDMENFNRILAAYEIIQTYRSTLDAACKRLKIPRDSLSKETFEYWKTVDRKSIRDSVEIQKSFEILDMHLNYTKKSLSWLRKKLNIHDAGNLAAEIHELSNLVMGSTTKM
ncbi:unnamed protein product [Rotaria magnacalcarata]|nr:unnamed protein product [Rotaria magnacalcarata]